MVPLMNLILTITTLLLSPEASGLLSLLPSCVGPFSSNCSEYLRSIISQKEKGCFDLEFGRFQPMANSPCCVGPLEGFDGGTL